MTYLRLMFVVVAATIGCGDNKTHLAPDAGMQPDANPATCSLALAAAALDGGTWDSRFTIPGVSGFDGHAPTVYDFARDIDGSIVVAGEFQYLAGKRVRPLIRWKNGAWEPARATWELEPPGAGFAAVAIDAAGKLALATYDDFGERSGEIWLDDGSGLRVIGAFDGLIRNLTWYDGKLWAAGWANIGEIANLAVWDGSAWAAPPGGAVDGPVYELVLDGTELLVGGAFSQVGGIAAASVAAYTGTQWRAMNFGDVAVYALARDANDQLYAGGTFGLRFGETGGIARWSGTAWQLAAGGLGNGFIVGVATDLVKHGDSLYVGGCFRTAGGAEQAPGAVASQGIARLDPGGQWHALDDGTKGVLGPWIEPQACGDEGPSSVWNVSKQRMFSDGSRLLLGGSFPGIDGVISQALIAHDTAWVGQGVDPAGGLGIGGSLDRIAASSSCDVWAMGQFTHVAGARSQARVVHFTGTAWETIADTIPRDAFCPGFAVSGSGEVSVGCMIFPQDGDAVGRVYRVAGGNLVQVGGDLPLVQAIAYDPDGKLWVAGGAATGYLARLDGDTLTMIEEGFDAPVNQLDAAGSSDIIVGGSFTKVGTLDAARIARWNGTAWSALGTGLPGFPTAITHDGATVYVSTFDEGAGQLMLGKFEGGTWTELATPGANLTPMSFFNFNALRVVGDAIVAVGTAELDDKAGRGALVYRAGQFRPLGGGVHASGLSSIAVTSDAIWIGGTIAEAGAAGQLTSTIGVARYVIAK